MSAIVYFYSRKGSNRYLASRIAKETGADIEELRPLINLHLWMVFGFFNGLHKLKNKPDQYDKVILCGPIWMGRLIAPLRFFILKYSRSVRALYFVTCCGSGFKMKDEKFGHGLVFRKVQELAGDKCRHCQAFPITLVIPEEKHEDAELVMGTRLNDDNFQGEILSLFNGLIEKLKA